MATTRLGLLPSPEQLLEINPERASGKKEHLGYERTGFLS